MKFKNMTGAKQRVRIEGNNPPDWKLVDLEETIDLPKPYGEALGLEPVIEELKPKKEKKPEEEIKKEEVKAVESKAGPKKIETKVAEKPIKKYKKKRW